MSTTNFSSGRSHTKSYEELLCSPFLVGGLQQQLSICFLAVDILLSITAFAGNSLILVALYKESSLHPPSKLLYRCLATTDLLVGLVAQPHMALRWMSVFQEPLSIRKGRSRHHGLCIYFIVFDDDDSRKRGQTSRPVVGCPCFKSLCQYARDATDITGYAFILLSLMTMTAVSVDRLLALLLELRYKQIVTLKRTYIIVTTFWVFNLVASLCGFFWSPYNRFVQQPSYISLPGNITRIVHKDFSHSQISPSTSTRSTTAEPNKCTEHGTIPKGSVQCTVGAVSISCLLCTNMDSGYCDRSY